MEIDELLKKVKRIHFIGIGGSGMCPLAEILHSKGYLLSGSDNNETDTLARIRSMGIPVTLGQKAENIEGAEMIVYTAAIMPDNPELMAALASGIPTYERSKLFGAITRLFGRCAGICGTHGKTTTTAMAVHTLRKAGMDPSAVIGGKLALTGTNGIVGSDDVIVCEACEFKDTFLDLSPSCAVILNIDADHLEYFKTMENLIASFTKFAEMAETVIYNADDANTVKALENVRGKNFVSFGTGENCNYRVVNLTAYAGAYAEFDIYRDGEFAVHLRLAVPGKHNALNAAAALAACVYCGADLEACKEGIESFPGAGRRFETLYRENGIVIADDYAHHPAELKVTLDAAMSMGYNRVWAVFQPFTYSRTSMLFNEFAEVLAIPDKCVMSEIMGSREKNTYGICTALLAEKIPGSVWFPTFGEITDYLYANVQPGDLVITLGCGDVYKVAKMLIAKYRGN